MRSIEAQNLYGNFDKSIKILRKDENVRKSMINLQPITHLNQPSAGTYEKEAFRSARDGAKT